ncbi:UNVERIFIED_CONTAM: hypothetical protein Sradi_6831400 [Sesamum radiatum]|uniref:SWIM-type domain-containing protein n=1 Tax=Sesamum radiatum TaxID=300843 RepID=A0AAW2JUJ5_SESRA
MGPFDQHNANLFSRNCSCRRWDLTGITCRHTISVIWCRNEDPEDDVHDVYKVSTYLRCYEHAIHGVNDAKLWPKWHNARTCNKRNGQAEEMLLGHLNPPALKRATILNIHPWSLSMHNLLLHSLQQQF